MLTHGASCDFLPVQFFFLIQKQLSQDVEAFSGYSLSLITCELHMNSDLSKVVVSKVSYLRSWSGSVR